MDIISGYGLVFLALACVFGLFMAWGIGANDVANAMGTSVGSTNKFLHEPTRQLNDASGQGKTDYLLIARDLFSLEKKKP